MPRPRKAQRKRVWTTRTTRPTSDPETGRKKDRAFVVVRWREFDGKVRQRSFTDDIEAGRFAAAKRDELAGEEGVALPRDALLSEFVNAYMSARFPKFHAWYRGETKRPVDGYDAEMWRAVQSFLKVIGDRPLRTYVSSDFERFRSRLRETTELAPATIEGRVARLRTVFQAARHDGLLREAPRIKVRQVRYQKAIHEIEDVREILEAARHWPPKASRGTATTGRLYPILATLYYSVMRRGELVHLTWKDLRREHGRTGAFHEILIQPKVWTEGGRTMRWEPKDHETRAIPVHPQLAAILEDVWQNRRSDKWIFTNTLGRRWNLTTLASTVVRFGHAIGRNVGFHIWRRSGLTHMHDAGAPPSHIQEIAGHSSWKTTASYVRTSAKGRHRAIRTLKGL